MEVLLLMTLVFTRMVSLHLRTKITWRRGLSMINLPAVVCYSHL